MRILILSCSTGEGHNACAAAILEYAQRRGAECVVKDSLYFVSDSLARFMSWGHVCMYRHVSWLFGLGYGFSERHSELFSEGAWIYRLMQKGARPLYDYIQKGGFDAVICTHVFSALTLTAMMREYSLNIPSSFVATDYTCSPGTKESTPDVCFIPDGRLMDEFSGIKSKRIVASGIPVRDMFYRTLPADRAKSMMGIPCGHRHLVMMCGSMGCGPMEKLARSVSAKLSEDQHLSIVCGTNQKLFDRLRREHKGKENVHVLGYVKDMSALLDSADLYLTKPGGISVTEAMLKGVPMVFVNAVAGCEEYNRQHFVNMGSACGGSTVAEISEICIRLLNDPQKTRDMQDSLRGQGACNAAEIIYDTMETLYEKTYH